MNLQHKMHGYIKVIESDVSIYALVSFSYSTQAFGPSYLADRLYKPKVCWERLELEMM